MPELSDQLHAERAAIEQATAKLHETSSSIADNELNQQRVEEYKFLRVELESIWDQTYTTINLILVIVGVIFAAAFNSGSGDPGFLLPMASIVTIGGYTLIRIHTTRVWRIVGYMRSALEPHLKGIRWETRLAERHRALRWLGKGGLDCDIFHGHIRILDYVNLALLPGIMITGMLGKSNFISSLARKLALPANKVDPQFWNNHSLLCASALVALIPLLTLLKSRFPWAGSQRGKSMEMDHLESWHYPQLCQQKDSLPPTQTETRVCDSHPPLDWQSYLKVLKNETEQISMNPKPRAGD
jgi:hypothetical protein